MYIYNMYYYYFSLRPRVFTPGCRAAARFDVVCNPRGVQYYTRGYTAACVNIVNRRRDGLEGFY